MKATGIIFRKRENIEADRMNKGWRCDCIEAIREEDGRTVGYIKLSYIPKAEWKRLFPDLFNFMDRAKGCLIFPYEKRYNAEAPAPTVESLSDEELVQFTNRAALHLGFSDITSRFGFGFCSEDYSVYPEGVTRETFYKFIEEELRPRAERRFGEEYREWVKLHVDTAIDDYIRVEDDYQRQGIATELYDQAVRWLNSRGIKMYLSSLRSDAAEAMIPKLKEAGMIGRKNKWGRHIMKKRPLTDVSLESLVAANAAKGFGNMLETGK